MSCPYLGNLPIVTQEVAVYNTLGREASFLYAAG
jgi:hypothetical protein